MTLAKSRPLLKNFPSSLVRIKAPPLRFLSYKPFQVPVQALSTTYEDQMKKPVQFWKKHRPSVLTLVSPFLFDLVQGSMHLLVDLIGEPIVRRVVQADLPAQVGRTGDFQEGGHGETWSSLCVRGLGQKGSLQWSVVKVHRLCIKYSGN